MKQEISITLWEQSAERILEIDKNLHAAAQELGIRIHLSIMSETPLLGRNRLLDKIPVLEIDGMQWRIRPYQVFTKEECAALLNKLTS